MLNAKQDQVITMILAGRSQKEAAAEVGVTPETVSRWKHEAEFTAEMNRQRKETWGAQRQRLQALVDDALQVYTDVLRAADDPKLRLRAARDVLDAVGLDEIPALTGPTTPEAVEKDREQRAAMAALFDCAVN